jgi:hypothetical protein
VRPQNLTTDVDFSFLSSSLQRQFEESQKANTKEFDKEMRIEKYRQSEKGRRHRERKEKAFKDKLKSPHGPTLYEDPETGEIYKGEGRAVNEWDYQNDCRPCE